MESNQGRLFPNKWENSKMIVIMTSWRTFQQCNSGLVRFKNAKKADSQQ